MVSSIVSTLLGESTKSPKVIENIKTVAVDGTDMEIGGYLDIGLFDTMKDLLVNFLGAAVFSVIGFVYVKSRGKNKIAKHFIPTVIAQEEENEENDENESKGN